MNGKRMKQARKKLGYTLADVAQRTGYSIGFISQLERNLKQPSLAALRKIAQCLESSEVWLFMDETQTLSDTSKVHSDQPQADMPNLITKRQNRRPMCLPEGTTHYEIFTPSVLPDGSQAKMTGMIVSIEPHHWVSEKMISHTNLDESVFLIKGEADAYIDDQIFHLQSGDHIYIPAGSMHNIVSVGIEPAEMIVYFSNLIY